MFFFHLPLHFPPYFQTEKSLLGTFGCEISAPILDVVSLCAKCYYIDTATGHKNTHKGIPKKVLKKFDLPAYAAGIEQQCKPQIIVEWY
jgi:hypothetical protein